MTQVKGELHLDLDGKMVRIFVNSDVTHVGVYPSTYPTYGEAQHWEVTPRVPVKAQPIAQPEPVRYPQLKKVENYSTRGVLNGVPCDRALIGFTVMRPLTYQECIEEGCTEQQAIEYLKNVGPARVLGSDGHAPHTA